MLPVGFVVGYVVVFGIVERKVLLDEDDKSMFDVSDREARMVSYSRYRESTIVCQGCEDSLAKQLASLIEARVSIALSQSLGAGAKIL